jgi:hypothetical protein
MKRFLYVYSFLQRGWGGEGRGGGREGENETYTKSKPSDAAHSLLAFTPGTVTTGSAPDLCVDLHSVQNIRFWVWNSDFRSGAHVC